MDNNHLLIQEHYIAYRSKLTHYALVCGMSQEDAEDIVQEAFLRLLSERHPIIEGTLSALLYNMVKNQIKDRWRHRTHVVQHEHYIKKYGTSWEDGMSVVSMHDTEEWLQRGMARLDSKSCRILRMSIEEGKKVGEIANLLDIKYKYAEHRLGMARKTIRQYLKAVGV